MVGVQSLSGVRLFATAWTAACQASLSFTVSWSLLKLMSLELVMPSSHLILCRPFSSCLQSFPASGSLPVSRSLHQVAKVLELQLQHQHQSWNSNVYSWLISFGIDWLDLLAVQGTLRSLLQHHSLKASFLQHSAFFVVLLSHLYLTAGKTIALTTQTFVGKVTSLVFNMLSRFQGSLEWTSWSGHNSPAST